MFAAGALAADAPGLGSEQQRLRDAREVAAAAQTRADHLQAAAAAEHDAAAQARAQEASVVASVQQAQAEIVAGQARSVIVERLLAAQRTQLATQQEPAVRLIAALQSLTRRPALLAIAQPGSIDDMVHVRAVLASALPAIRARTAGLRTELDRTRGLQADVVLARQSLVDGQRKLEQRRLELARLEAAHDARGQALGRQALVESDRAIAMGERARDLVDQMGAMGNQATTGQALAQLPGPDPRPARPGEAAGGDNLTGWTEDTAPYRLPVSGQLQTGFGEVSDAGVRSRGLTFAVTAGAPVIAPAAARIAYAGPFRDYGEIVILDHGQGWTTLVTGLGQANVHTGQSVAQGRPLGTAPDNGQPHVTIELRRKGRPVDMLPLTG
jgi:murein DD-endopeptidase MepM/ murein hydrolase activator NlpD